MYSIEPLEIMYIYLSCVCFFEKFGTIKYVIPKFCLKENHITLFCIFRVCLETSMELIIYWDFKLFRDFKFLFQIREYVWMVNRSRKITS